MNLESSYLELFNKENQSSDYHLVSFRPISKDESYVSTFTKWVGHKDKFEVRAADVIKFSSAIRDFRLMNYPLAIINKEEELTTFLKVGGHSLISEHLIRKNWKELLTPQIVVDTSEREYLEYSAISLKDMQRFAKGQLRMQIFERDNFQCKICGSSPDDNIHVRLEVHHIKPWEEGGLTIPENLITLCKVCHEGVSQIGKELLYKKIGLVFPKIKHEFYPRSEFGTADQIYCHLRLMSNIVTFKI